MKVRAILLPTDFSKSSAAALEYAMSLASKTGATLHIVHVADDSPGYLAGYGGFGFMADFPNQLKREIEARLDRIDSSRTGVDVQRHYLTGMAVTEIVEFADCQKIDLIVMGTHGRTGLSRVLMGSVAEGVLRRSNCPVLTIKIPLAVGEEVGKEHSNDSHTTNAETTTHNPLRTRKPLKGQKNGQRHVRRTFKIT